MPVAVSQVHVSISCHLLGWLLKCWHPGHIAMTNQRFSTMPQHAAVYSAIILAQICGPACTRDLQSSMSSRQSCRLSQSSSLPCCTMKQT